MSPPSVRSADEDASITGIPSSDPRYSQSLARGLAILRTFSAKRPVLGIADIAEALDMTRSTTHRYMITLVALGYLEQGTSRKYRLGLRVTDLGSAALNSTGLREHAHTHLQELRRRSSCATSLGVLDGIDLLYVERVRGFPHIQNQIELSVCPGSRLPAYATSMGKLLLANLPEPEQRELIVKMKLSKHAPNTITSKKALREELERIRAASFALEDQELAPELYAVAAPVRDQAGGVVAAVDLVAHRSKTSLEQLHEVLAPQLLVTAERISASISHTRKDNAADAGGR
jgi:IclR family transcriptional regulator, pca regulon regulatory protein